MFTKGADIIAKSNLIKHAADVAHFLFFQKPGKTSELLPGVSRERSVRASQRRSRRTTRLEKVGLSTQEFVLFQL